MNAKRRDLAARLTTALEEIPEITAPVERPGNIHVYQMYTIRVQNGLRDKLLGHLTERGIMAKIYFPPVHQTHFYKNELKYDYQLPVTENLCGQVLTLPMYPALTETEINHIADEIINFYQGK